MAKVREKIISWDDLGGLNLNPEDTLEGNEFTQLINFDYDNDGLNIIEPRKGSNLLNATFEKTTKISSLININTATEFQIAQAGTTLYDNAGDEIGGAGNGTCTSSTQTAQLFMDTVFIAPGQDDSGTVKMMRYNRSTDTVTLQADGPEDARFLVKYKDRLWCVGLTDNSNRARVFYSEPYMNDNDNDADDWDIPNNFIDVAPDDGYEVVALIPTPQALLVCKENGDIYPIFGAFSDEFAVPQFPITNKGPVSHRTQAVHKGVAYWLGDDDVYQFIGGQVGPVSKGRELYSEFKNIQSSQSSRDEAVAVVTDDDYIVCFRQDDYSINNKCYVFDTARRTWREYDGYQFHYEASCVTSDGTWIVGQNQAGTDSKYRLLQMRTGYADSVTASGDTNIIAEATSKEFFPTTGYMEAQAKRLFARMAYSTVSVTLTLLMRPGLLDTSTTDYRAKSWEFQKASDSSSTSNWYDGGDNTAVWANDDATAEAGALVWADDSYNVFSLQDLKRTFNLIGRTLKFSIYIEYDSSPEFRFQRALVHYLPKRRIP